jgi:hypothetical protein
MRLRRDPIWWREGWCSEAASTASPIAERDQNGAQVVQLFGPLGVVPGVLLDAHVEGAHVQARSGVGSVQNGIAIGLVDEGTHPGGEAPIVVIDEDAMVPRAFQELRERLPRSGAARFLAGCACC